MISWLCPSRGRPELAMTLLNSLTDNQFYDNQLLFYLQSDDDRLDEYISNFKKIGYKEYVIGPYYRMQSLLWERLMPYVRCDYMGLIGDDVFCHTKNWDQILYNKLSQYDDNIVVGAANMYTPKLHIEKIKNNTFRYMDNCHPIIHRKWFDTLGFFHNPIFPGACGDDWVLFLGQILGRYEFCPNVYLEHYSYTRGRVEDKTTDSQKMGILLTPRDTIAYVPIKYNVWLEQSLYIWDRAKRWFISDLEALNAEMSNPLTREELVSRTEDQKDLTKTWWGRVRWNMPLKEQNKYYAELRYANA